MLKHVLIICKTLRWLTSIVCDVMMVRSALRENSSKNVRLDERRKIFVELWWFAVRLVLRFERRENTRRSLKRFDRSKVSTGPSDQQPNRLNVREEEVSEQNERKIFSLCPFSSRTWRQSSDVSTIRGWFEAQANSNGRKYFSAFIIDCWFVDGKTEDSTVLKIERNRKDFIRRRTYGVDWISLLTESNAVSQANFSCWYWDFRISFSLSSFSSARFRNIFFNKSKIKQETTK